MKASAVVVACLVFVAPAQAFVHGGAGHGPGLHPGFGHGPHPGFGHDHHHHGRGGYGYGLDAGLWGGVAVPEYPLPEQSAPVELAAPSNFPPPEVIAATIAAASALAAAQPSGPDRPASAPPRPRGGAHVIYIGQRPAFHGPRVIYGNE